MEFGGIKTKYLFADKLEKGLIVVGGTQEVSLKSGEKVKYLVGVGEVNGEVGEWLIAPWSVESKVKVNSDIEATYRIKPNGKRILFELA
jgi:hypothetical protein